MNWEYQKITYTRQHITLRFSFQQIELIQNHVLVFERYIKRNMFNNPVKWHFKVYKRELYFNFMNKKNVHTHTTYTVYYRIHSLHCITLHTHAHTKLKSNIESEKECTIYFDVCISNKRSVTLNTRSAIE